MAENPWVPFYFGDYLADTGTLSLREHGAYLLLLAEAYRQGGTIPLKPDANASVLHRLCRCTDDADRAAVDEILARFFVRTDAGFFHSRVNKVLARREKISEKRSAAAAARWDANASVLHMQSQPQPKSEPQPKTHSPARSVEVGSPRGGQPAPRRAPAKVRHPLPPDFDPGPRCREIAAAAGLDIAAALDAMRDWADAKGERCLDWQARFANWLRREAANPTPKPSVNGRHRPPDKPGLGAPSTAAHDFWCSPCMTTHRGPCPKKNGGIAAHA